MPFGLTNARATFKRAMDGAFKGLIGKIIEIYQDDFTVFSKNGIFHIGHLRQIFDRCREYGISLNLAKSIFGVTEGKLLSHIISKDGIKIDLERVEAIQKIHLPHNIKTLQSFLGKINFLRRFIPNYAELAKGYTCLLKKGVPFVWNQVAQASFDSLKESLMKASLMYTHDYQKYLNLYMAAADTTITMVLVQEDNGIEHPIYYLSRNLNDIEESIPMLKIWLSQQFK